MAQVLWISDVKDAGQVSARAALRAELRERPRSVQATSVTKSEIDVTMAQNSFTEHRSAGAVQAVLVKHATVQCPLLHLPGELRTRIYVMVFEPPHSDVQGQSQTAARAPIHFLNDLNPPPLARVCRQIRTECLSIFLQTAVIHILLNKAGKLYEMHILPDTLSWLEAEIGLTRPIMRKVHLHLDTGSEVGRAEYIFETQRPQRHLITHGNSCDLCTSAENNEEICIPAMPDNLETPLSLHAQHALEGCRQELNTYQSVHKEQMSCVEKLLTFGDHGISIRDVGRWNLYLNVALKHERFSLPDTAGDLLCLILKNFNAVQNKVRLSLAMLNLQVNLHAMQLRAAETLRLTREAEVHAAELLQEVRNAGAQAAAFTQQAIQARAAQVAAAAAEEQAGDDER